MWLEWFDYDNHLTWEVKKSLANDWQISQEEAKFMADIIDKYWRRNIKIKKRELIKLWREFWLNYSKLSRIWPALEKRIKQRANIISESKKNLWSLREETDSIRNLEKEFPSIRSVDRLKRSLKKMKRTREHVLKKLRWAERKHLDDSQLITIRYSRIKDNVTVWDLKWVLKAMNFAIEADTRWIKKSKWNKIDYKQIADYAAKHSERNDIWKIEKLVSSAMSYLWKSERNVNLRKEITRLSKQLDWRPFDIRYEAWCAMFTRLMLIKAWYRNSANKMNAAALSALFPTYETWYHIWISIGWWKFIDWNSWKSTDRVTKDSVYRWYRKRGFIWWVMPNDVWNPSKVHFTKPPLTWAIVVFARWSWLSRKVKRARAKIRKLS